MNRHLFIIMDIKLGRALNNDDLVYTYHPAATYHDYTTTCQIWENRVKVHTKRVCEAAPNIAVPETAEAVMRAFYPYVGDLIFELHYNIKMLAAVQCREILDAVEYPN